jgi:hypothetical protein
MVISESSVTLLEIVPFIDEKAVEDHIHIAVMKPI